MKLTVTYRKACARVDPFNSSSPGSCPKNVCRLPSIPHLWAAPCLWRHLWLAIASSLNPHHSEWLLCCYLSMVDSLASQYTTYRPLYPLVAPLQGCRNIHRTHWNSALQLGQPTHHRLTSGCVRLHGIQAIPWNPAHEMPLQWTPEIRHTQCAVCQVVETMNVFACCEQTVYIHLNVRWLGAERFCKQALMSWDKQTRHQTLDPHFKRPTTRSEHYGTMVGHENCGKKAHSDIQKGRSLRLVQSKFRSESLIIKMWVRVCLCARRVSPTLMLQNVSKCDQSQCWYQRLWRQTAQENTTAC